MAGRRVHQRDDWVSMFWKNHQYNERTRLKSGTYLNAFCPHCSKELTWKNQIHFEIRDAEGNRGDLELSPYLSVYDRHTDLRLQEGQEAQDLLCPHCHISLIVEGERCGECKSHIAGFVISASTLKVPFFICLRVGCHWHAISREDESDIILDDSNEW